MSKAEKIFTRVYAENLWQDPESRSGPGSTATRTDFLRSQLSRLLRELDAHSLLDVPCGDFNWMQLAEMPSVDYIGADIVADMVRKNAAQYGKPGRKFIQVDITRGPLPKVDLILCRDGLVHLSFADIERALQVIQQSQSTYLLLTAFTDCAWNIDITTGYWRPLNFQLAPFNFPASLQILADKPLPDGQHAGKALALYRVEGLPAQLKYSRSLAAYQRITGRVKSKISRMLQNVTLWSKEVA